MGINRKISIMTNKLLKKDQIIFGKKTKFLEKRPNNFFPKIYLSHRKISIMTNKLLKKDQIIFGKKTKFLEKRPNNFFPKIYLSQLIFFGLFPMLTFD